MRKCEAYAVSSLFGIVVTCRLNCSLNDKW